MKEIAIDRISKSYKTVKALDGFSCVLKNGVYALLGPNGSGKSTLMNILTQNLKQDEGDIFVDGVNIKDIGMSYRGMLGYMPQYAGVFSRFTLYDFLSYMAQLKGLERKSAKKQIYSLAEAVELSENINKPLGSFSGGMKQRALLAQALLGSPSLVILDEPTAGLDPLQRINVKKLIAKYSENACVLIATHIVPDIDGIADEVIMLKKGVIAAKGSPNTVKNGINAKFWDIPADELNGNPAVKVFKRGEDSFARVMADEHPGDTAVSVTPDIEDCYYYYFGNSDYEVRI